MLDALRATGGLDNQSLPSKFLFAVRGKLGALFGWDKATQSLGVRVGSLCERLPADLRQESAGQEFPGIPFTMVYELGNECAIELANRTVHTVCHLGWVRTADGDYELRLAVLVKPNGAFGRLYMAGIAPFRYLIVYPAMTRQWERAWRDRWPGASSGTTGNGITR
jgi:Protein of unknown function (DUF2867)